MPTSSVIAFTNKIAGYVVLRCGVISSLKFRKVTIIKTGISYKSVDRKGIPVIEILKIKKHSL